MKCLAINAIRKLNFEIEQTRKAKRKHGHDFADDDRASYWDDKLAELEFRLAKIRRRFDRVAFERNALASLYSRAG